MEDLQKAVEGLKRPDVAYSSKLSFYLIVENMLANTFTCKNELGNEAILRILWFPIKNDITETPELRKIVLDVLEAFFLTVQQPVLEICTDAVLSNESRIAEEVSDRMKKLLKKCITEKSFDLEQFLSHAKNRSDIKKLLDILKNAFTSLEYIVGVEFFYEDAIPLIFKTNEAEMRRALLDFAMDNLSSWDVGLLGLEKIEKLRLSTKHAFREQAIKVFDQGDPDWKRMCVLLIRIFGKRLYTYSDAFNGLLNVMEGAFQTKSEDKLLAGYDCWKELIDVCKLNMTSMCSAKYLKVLLLPLRKSSLKYKHARKKCFDVWVYFIDTLQDKVFDLCLPQFLEFCFGPLRENPLLITAAGSSAPTSEGNLHLWPDVTKALLELLGHRAFYPRCHCFELPSSSLFNLKEPVITPANIVRIDYIVVNAVGECCSLLVEIIRTKCAKEGIANASILLICEYDVIKCLWRCLFKLVEQMEHRPQEQVIRRITALLAVFIEIGGDKPIYLDCILQSVCQVLIEEDLFKIDPALFNRQLLFPLLKTILKKNILWERSMEMITPLLIYSKNTPNKNNWLEAIFEIFVKTEVKPLNIEALFSLWIECSDMLATACESPTQQTEKTMQAAGVGFMVWPLLNLPRLEQRTEIIEKFVGKWGVVFEVFLRTYTKTALNILADLRSNVEKNNAPSYCALYSCFESLLTNEINSKFVLSILNLTFAVLSHLASTKDVQAILPSVFLIMNYFIKETDLNIKYADFQLLCKIFETLLEIHKEYSLLEKLDNFFSEIPKSFKENIPKSLYLIIYVLQSHSDLAIATQANKLFENDKILPPNDRPDDKMLKFKDKNLSRAAKIANMAIATSKGVHNNKKDEPLQLLVGYRIDTSKVRGNQLNNTPKPVRRRTINPVFEIKPNPLPTLDGEANIAVIDQEVTFDPTRLAEQQLEVLKKRRSDIPALYQDLSQSHSNTESSMIQHQKKEGDSNTVENDELKQEEKIISEDLFHSQAAVCISGDDKNKEDIKMLDSQSTDLGNKLDKENKGNTMEQAHCLDDLKIKNPSMKQIEAFIVDSEDSSDLDMLLADEKRKQKIMKEWNKIKMDIVGGDAFVKELNLTERIRTRRRSDVLSKKEEDSSNENGRKAKLRPIVKVVEKEPNDQSHENKSKSIKRRRKSEDVESAPKIQKKSEPFEKIDDCLEKTTKSADNDTESSSNSAEEIKTPSNTMAQESEDIIESSQESFVDVKLGEKSTTLPNEGELNIVEIVGLEYSSKDEIEFESEVERLKLLAVSPDQLMANDLTAHIQPASTSEMETQSPELSSPSKSINIPTSPVAHDTPTRTKELIDNTVNISPIKCDSVDSQTPDILLSEKLEPKNLFPPEPKAPSPEKSESYITTNAPPEPKAPSPEKSGSYITTNPRALKLVTQIDSPKMSQQKFKTYASPKPSRIMKMIQTCGKPPDQEVLTVEIADEEPKKIMLERDVLKFVREIPSPKASPSHGILKRREPDTKEEGLSPPRKKRVNFSDPPTTCEKVYFKDQNEHTVTMQDLIELGIDNLKPPVDIPIVNTPEDTESLATQGSVDNTNMHLLQCNQPILPELVDCTEKFDAIIGKLTSPLFVAMLTEELHKRNIFTVGDLAKMSEIEVGRLPFKVPKILVVRSTLRKFASQKNAEKYNCNGASTAEKTESESKNETRAVESETKDVEPQNKNDVVEPENKNTVRGVASESKRTENGNEIRVVGLDGKNQVRIIELPGKNDTRIRAPTKIGLAVRTETKASQVEKSFIKKSVRIETEPESPQVDMKKSVNIVSSVVVKPAASLTVKTANFKNLPAKNAQEIPLLTAVNSLEEKMPFRIIVVDDYNELKKHMEEQGRSPMSFCDTIINLVGIKEFIAMLSRKTEIPLRALVQGENWKPIFEELLKELGLTAAITLLCETAKTTPTELFLKNAAHCLQQDDSNVQEQLTDSVVKSLGVKTLVRKIGAPQIVDELCELSRNSEFPTEEFLRLATAKLNPSLEGIVPSSSNLTRGEDAASSFNKVGLQDLTKKLLKISMNENSPNTEDILDLIPESNKEETCSALFNKLPSEKQQELAFSSFDSMSDADAFDCLNNYFRKRLRKS